MTKLCCVGISSRHTYIAQYCWFRFTFHAVKISLLSSFMSSLSLKSSPSSDKNKSITQNEKGVAFYHVLMPLTPISPVRKRTVLTMTMRTKLKERGIFLVQNTLSGCTIVLPDREDCFPSPRLYTWLPPANGQ